MSVAGLASPFRHLRPWVTLLAALLAAPGCATSIPIRTVADLAGEWRGRISSPRGHALASMTIRDDGGYTGTMFLDGGDQRIYGAIVAVGAGRVRYQGSDGSGLVRLQEKDGERVLEFLRDDGGIDGAFKRH